MKLKPGFVPALLTPIDANGNLDEASYRKQIEDMIQAGAVGLLALGSMGKQAFLRPSNCVEVARVAVDAAAGRVPVFVGAMDVSICRAKERIAAMEHLDVSAFVFTAPYYEALSFDEMSNYIKAVAASTKHNVMVYDLPGVTRFKFNYNFVLRLRKEVPNLIGIKSADTQMFRKLVLDPEVPEDFIMVYSGLDTFDVAYKWGITNCLDGMLPLTPKNTEKMFKAMAEGDYDTAATCLNNIVYLRDRMAAHDLWPCASEIMHMLGYSGNHAPDWCNPIKPENVAVMRADLEKIGEL